MMFQKRTRCNMKLALLSDIHANIQAFDACPVDVKTVVA